MAKSELEIEINATGNVSDAMDSIVESVTEVTGSLEEMAAMMGNVASDELSEVAAATDEVAESTAEVATKSEDATSAMDVLGGVAAGVTVAFIAVGAAIYGAISAVWGFVEAAGESEIVEWRLDATLQALGETAEVTFGGMSEELKKSLDKMNADMQKSQDKLLASTQKFEDKRAEMTSDTLLKVRRFDEDTADGRAKLVDDLKDSLAIKERKIGEATTKERRKAAQIAYNDARKAADERVAEYDAERAKRRRRMMEDTARDFTELDTKYKKEQALAQADYDETARKAAEANKLAAEQAAKTVSIVRPTKDEIMKLADEISTASGFDDEELISGMTKLLRMVPATSETFSELAGYAADLAAVGDKDIATAFQGIALFAQTGDIGRLKRDLGELTPAQEEMMKAAQDSGDVFAIQAAALSILRDNFGEAGSKAAEYGNTFEGLMGKISTTMGNAQEAIGGPALTGIKSALDVIMPSLIEAGKAFGELLGTPEMQQKIKDMGTWIGNELVPLIEKGVNWLANDAPVLMDQFTTWWDENTPQIRANIESIGGILGILGDALRIAAGVFDFVLQHVFPVVQVFEGFVKVLGDAKTGWDLAMSNINRDIKTLTDSGFVAWLKLVGESFTAVGKALLTWILPDWATPGSPTPLEMGIRGITDAMSEMTPMTTGAFGAGGGSVQRAMPAMGGGGVTVVYSPAMSLGNRAEFEAQFVPVLNNALRRLNRGSV